MKLKYKETTLLRSDEEGHMPFELSQQIIGNGIVSVGRMPSGAGYIARIKVFQECNLPEQRGQWAYAIGA